MNIQLDPSCDNYAVVGNPVAHSKSPRIHKAFAAQTSQSLSYQAIPVPIDRFVETVRAFRDAGGKGLNVTVPFKEEAFRLATQLSGRARTAGAVNTLSFGPEAQITGDNTDGTGLMRDLENHAVRVTGRRVLILGAGGAVRGVLGPLLEQGPERLLVANRTAERAIQLVRPWSPEHAVAGSGLDTLAKEGQFDLIINAISSGLHGEMPPLPDTLPASQACCYDMVYGESETVFNRWARQHGVAVVLDGLGMLVEQAAESFYLWRGIRPDTAPVIAMLREEMRQG